jgi:mannose-6-phosphate isomerase-like protein (cupin superfamily)
VTDLDRAYLLRSGESVLPGSNEYMRVLVGGAQSEGQYAWLHYTMDHDAVPHVHEQEDESVYLLDGEITVHIGPDSYDLGAGDFIFMPRLVPHAITVRSGTYRGMSVSAPGGVFDNIIRERSAARDAGEALDEDAQWRIREKYGMRRVDSLTEGGPWGEGRGPR